MTAVDTLVVIFGAGASKGCYDPRRLRRHERRTRWGAPEQIKDRLELPIEGLTPSFYGSDLTMPVTADLVVDNGFTRWVSSCVPRATPVVDELRLAMQERQREPVTLERALARYRTEQRGGEATEQHLDHFQEWLWWRIWGPTWLLLSQHGAAGVTRYLTVVRRIEQWRAQAPDGVERRVVYITFNYDTLLENALRRTLPATLLRQHETFESGPVQLYKPHGSLDFYPEPKDIAHRATVRIAGNDTAFGDVRPHDTRRRAVMALPVLEKQDFPVWQEHLANMRGALEHGVSRILTVGWRGMESHFTEGGFVKLTATGRAVAVDYAREAADGEKAAGETLQHLGVEPEWQQRRIGSGFADLTDDPDGTHFRWLLDDETFIRVGGGRLQLRYQAGSATIDTDAAP